MMRNPLRITALVAAALALLSAGFAAGQHQAPTDDRATSPPDQRESAN